MDPKKEHLLDTSGFIHMDSERLLQHAQYLLKFKPDKFSALRRGGRGKVPSQTKSLFGIDACWEKENQFAPRENHWVYQSYSWEEELVSRKQTVFVYLILWDLLQYFFCLIGIVCFVFLYLLLRALERVYINLGGQSHQSWGKGKYDLVMFL